MGWLAYLRRALLIPFAAIVALLADRFIGSLAGP
jgi:hypothetical protein